MLLIYTGDGKGKTSACVGQAIRAIGQSFDVYFAQMIKKDVGAGEQTMLKKLLDKRFVAGGIGFFTKEETRPEHREAALRTLLWCSDAIRQGRAGMLVVDEMLYAMGAGLITDDEVRKLIVLAQEHDCHLVLSGRNCPEWLKTKADLVSELDEVKHPCRMGVPAQKGIEF